MALSQGRAGNGGESNVDRRPKSDLISPHLTGEIAAMIDAAAVDKPSISELIFRLERVGMKVYPSIQADGRLNGFSYGWNGHVVKGSTIGRAYTASGLQTRKGVSYEPSRDNPEIQRAAAVLRLTPIERSRESESPRAERSVRTVDRDSGLDREQAELVAEIGRFRTIAVDDIGAHRYGGNMARLQRDLRVLRERGLADQRSISDPKSGSVSRVVVLTRAGRVHAQKAASRGMGGTDVQQFYSGLVKPAEVRHDAAIYRMYQTERRRIEGAGGTVRRVVLDYELKRKVYAELNRPDGDDGSDRAHRKRAIAEENGLAVVNGRVVLPDLRIEYATQDQDLAYVDLELASDHYKTAEVMQKHAAGLKIYGPASSPRSPALRDPEIVAGLISF
jgi:hypothetical protein